MIDISIKFQVVLFGMFADITPKPETLTYLIGAFSDKELIPTTYQELGITGPINRLSFSSSNDVWKIEIGTNRIDIQKLNKDVGVTDMNKLSNFIADAKQIIKILDTKFPKQYNRLSLVTRHLIKQLSADEMVAVFNKSMNTIKLYKENRPVDWKVRAASRIPMNLKSKELSNVISEMGRLRGTILMNSKLQPIDRIELTFDINTFQGNNEFRFSFDDVCLFLDEAFKLETELETEFVELIS